MHVCTQSKRWLNPLYPYIHPNIQTITSPWTCTLVLKLDP